MEEILYVEGKEPKSQVDKALRELKAQGWGVEDEGDPTLDLKLSDVLPLEEIFSLHTKPGEEIKLIVEPQESMVQYATAAFLCAAGVIYGAYSGGELLEVERQMRSLVDPNQFNEAVRSLFGFCASSAVAIRSGQTFTAARQNELNVPICLTDRRIMLSVPRVISVDYKITSGCEASRDFLGWITGTGTLSFSTRYNDHFHITGIQKPYQTAERIRNIMNLYGR
mgnify:CR=1 FL=1